MNGQLIDISFKFLLILVVLVFLTFFFSALTSSVSLKTYAHDDTSVGSWMMGVQATYIDDNHLCCSTSRQGISFSTAEVLFFQLFTGSEVSSLWFRYSPTPGPGGSAARICASLGSYILLHLNYGNYCYQYHVFEILICSNVFSCISGNI